MTNEIKLKNISIGFDTDIIGIGLGILFNRESRIIAISLFGVFILLTIPKLRRYKIITAKMIDFRTLKAEYGGETRLYFVKPSKTFEYKSLFIRDRKTGEIEEVFRFKLIEDKSGFGGVLAYRKGSVTPSFYFTDEYYFVSPLQIVRGYINHKSAEFIILSIVD